MTYSASSSKVARAAGDGGVYNDQPRRARRPLDGPLTSPDRARESGTCARCTRRYPRWAPIRWLPGSGPVHAECAPQEDQARLMHAAAVLAAASRDAGELRELLVMVGLISPHAARRARLAASHRRRSA
jgi:hypothetical protein